MEQLIIELKQTAILLLSNGMTKKLSHSFVGIDPIAEISRYHCSAQEKVAVNQSNIVKVYNTFMDGVDKLGMVC